MTKIRDTKDRQFHAVVKVRKAELIKPSESQLMSYYMDYGYTNIDDVIEDYGEEEMLREWYNNTNFTQEFQTHQLSSSIYPIDWDSEWEQVDVIAKKDWNDIYDTNYGF
jgi:urate oxidase